MAYARLDEPIGDAAATRAPPPPRCGRRCAEILPVGRPSRRRRTPSRDHQSVSPQANKPAYAQRRLTPATTTTATDHVKTTMSSSRLLALALLALQPWSGAARPLRGRRRLEAADDKPLTKPMPPTTPVPPKPAPHAEEPNHDAEEAIFQELYGGA